MRHVPGLIAIAALCVSLPAAAASLTSTTEGRMMTKRGDAVVDVPLEHTDVTIRVDGHLADATVVQRFKNPYPSKIVAVYLFPLPATAAVTDMTITVGTRTIHGTIQERAKAQQTYVAARKQGLVAALLTQERPNLFTQSIANLEADAAIEVTLRYTQRLDYDSGGYTITFPMVAGPRYVPAQSKDAKAAAAVQPVTLPAGLRSSHDISLQVELDAGVPIEGLASSSHQIVIQRPSSSRATVRLAAGDTVPNKDFILTYQVAGAVPALAVLAHRDGGASGTGSFMLVAQPPENPKPADVTPREIVFVLDTSSSMRGAPLAKAKELVRRILWTLRADDTYQIVRFADRSSGLGPAMIANKPRNVELTLEWLGKLEAAGGTEVIEGVSAALALPHDPLRLRLVVFISDGYVGNEDEILATVGKHVGTARLFSFGIGSAVNRFLLEEMATMGRGAVQVVRPDEDTASAVNQFEHRIDAPLLSDITLDWGTLPVADVTPHAVPDLFAGQPLVVTGHYAGATRGTLRVRAKQAGRDVTFDVAVSLPETSSRPAIGALWARQRIGELSRALLRKPDPAADREIVALSLEHHLLSSATAFVAVDDSRVTGGKDGKRVVVPVEVPESVRGISAAGYGASGGGGYGVGYGSSGYASYGSIGYGHTVTHAVYVAPTVTIGSPVATGDLDKQIIRRYVRRHLAKITYCYEKQLLSSPTLAGTVRVEFVVDSASGHVAGVSASGLGDKEVETCIAGVIRTIEFPAAPGGGPVKINYPFTLKPAGTL
jgi:Ca-activated chloride channel family protein